MHQVRTPAYLPFFLTSFITAFSSFPTTTSTALWASEKTEACYHEEPSSSTTCSCTTYDPTASRSRYHLQNPPRLIMQRHPSSMFRSRRLKSVMPLRMLLAKTRTSCPMKIKIKILLIRTPIHNSSHSNDDDGNLWQCR
ncbi:hypothetical protein BDR03DRAFT_966509 [Suillus americanus]|nr:hypothetical protein BDR03DRAFT_966509 [Suillus americanus]